MSLGRGSHDPTGKKDKRPFQKGKAKGKKGGKDIQVEKEWLVDTGAMRSAINEDNAKNFDTKATAGTGTGGEAGIIPIVSGITMVFKRFNKDGKEEEVECTLDVMIIKLKRDVLGVDQLDHFNCDIQWNARKGIGKIFEVAEEKKEGLGPSGPVKKLVEPPKVLEPKIEQSLRFYVESGIISEAEKNELLLERMAFEADRSAIEERYDGKTVGVAGGELFVGESIHDVILKVREKMPGKLPYIETVGSDILGGLSS